MKSFFGCLLLLLCGILPAQGASPRTPPLKIWHTEPSPLLLRELQDSARHSRLGGEVGIAIYSLRDQRFEAEWNDTDRFGPASFAQPREAAVQLVSMVRSLENHRSPEGFIRFQTTPTDTLQGAYGAIFAADGDTLTAVLWIKSFQGTPAAASALTDSLFSLAARWYNKERPALSRADTLLSLPEVPQGYAARLRYFSRALLGTPYALGPTGEGRYGAVESLPIVDLRRFDCVTYIESSVALAASGRAADLLPIVLFVRYRGDTVAYATRNHFFVGDWLGNNPGKFRILRLPGDTVEHKTLYKGKLLAAKGLLPPPSDPVVGIPYLPYEKALQLAENWTLGKRLLGVAFVTRLPGLDVTHTGFIDAESGKPVLRHASELKGKVVEQDFKEYLESRRGKCAGVLLFEFLPPPGGG